MTLNLQCSSNEHEQISGHLYLQHKLNLTVTKIIKTSSGGENNKNHQTEETNLHTTATDQCYNPQPACDQIISEYPAYIPRLIISITEKEEVPKFQNYNIDHIVYIINNMSRYMYLQIPSSFQDLKSIIRKFYLKTVHKLQCTCI